jgi:hypothetical protein
MEVKQWAALIALDVRISPNLQGKYIHNFNIRRPFRLIKNKLCNRTVNSEKNYVASSRE